MLLRALTMTLHKDRDFLTVEKSPISYRDTSGVLLKYHNIELFRKNIDYFVRIGIKVVTLPVNEK